MAEILFVAKGTGGDLVPFPSLGAALKKHGHHVTLLSHCTYAGMAAELGWDFIALDNPEERQQMIADGQLLNSPSGYPAYFRRHILPKALAEYQAIQACYHPRETVLVTTHKASLVPLLAAERLGIPLMRMFATLSELVTLPLMADMYRDILAAEVNQVRDEVGLAPTTDWAAWLRRTDREIALWPEWFAAPDEAWPVEALPIGFIQETGAEIPEEAAHMLETGEPPVLVTAGTGLFTDPRFYTASAEACRILDRRAMLVTRYPQLIPDALPAQVRHFEQLPFATIMPHVAAIVHHGGVGTLACALASGVPQLVLAAGGDRPENGMRIQKLGVGEYLLPPRWQADQIAAALRRILTSSAIRAHCQDYAARLRASDTAGLVCEQIESLIAQSHTQETKTRSDRDLSSPDSSPVNTPDSKVAMSPKPKLSPEKQALLLQKLREKREQAAKLSSAEQGIVAGPMPVIPILMVDYVHKKPQAWWHAVEALVEIPRALGAAQIAEVVRQLVAQHDGLRIRLTNEHNEYKMSIAETDESVFLTQDLSALSSTEQDQAIEVAIPKQWTELNFSRGPLLRVVFFDLGLQRPPRVLVILHHFAADGYSVGVLLYDFQTACQQLLLGEPIKLRAKSSSIKQWAEVMHAYVKSSAAQPELDYWESLPWSRVRPTPVDHPEATQSPAASLTDFLNEDETHTLLSKVLPTYHIQLVDVLLTACAMTYTHYAQLDPFLVTVLHHGRNMALEGLDLLRTVGNLYTSYPLLLDVTDLALTAPDKALRKIAEQRLRVPNEGTAWFWVSYYNDLRFVAWNENLKIPRNVVFNYLGQIKTAAQPQASLLRQIERPAQADAADIYDVTGIPPHTCETVIENGRLKVTWEYFSLLDEPAAIKRLIQQYLEVLRSFIKTTG